MEQSLTLTPTDRKVQISVCLFKKLRGDIEDIKKTQNKPQKKKL